MDKKFKQALNRAKVHIMEHPNSAFISTILFNCKLNVTTSIPTAGVDGTNLYINPEFFMAQKPRVRVSILFHEAWHVAWNHPMRGKDLEHEKYNIAGDHVINLMGKAAGYEIPDTWYCDPQYQGMSTLEVYNKLPDDKFEKEGGPTTDVIYFDGNGDDQETKKKELEWAGIVKKATVVSRIQKDKAGTIPGEIEVALDKILNPKLPWNELLINYMTSYAKDDYSYRRPNRKFWPQFYLPSAYSEAIGHIAVAVDTSGSVTDAEFNAFRTEIMGIQEMLKPELLTVLSFDTKIKKEVKLTADQDFSQETFTGRGGTDIDPVWKWTKKNQPICIIIFSDMRFTYPSSTSGTDVLWVCVNNAKVTMPHGTTIHLQL